MSCSIELCQGVCIPFISYFCSVLLPFATVIMHSVTKSGTVIQWDCCHKGVGRPVLYSYQLVCGRASGELSEYCKSFSA